MRAVCFDVGNVLCGFTGDASARYLHDSGRNVSPGEFAVAELAGRDRINEMVRQAAGFQVINMDHVRSYFGCIFERLGIPRKTWPGLEDELLRESERENLGTFACQASSKSWPSWKRRGYPMGVVSNSDGRIAELMTSSGIAPFLSFIIDSAVVGIDNRMPRIFRMAIERFSLSPGQIVFVGDIYEVDVAGSRATGMRPVLVDPRGNVCGYDCPVIRTLHGLPGLLEQSRSM